MPSSIQTVPKAKAKARGKVQDQARAPNAKAAKAQASTSDKRGMEDDETQQNASESSKKRSKTKTDPVLAARLQQLEIDKNLLLAKQKWVGKVKIWNKEVSQSVFAAENFEQTEGFPSLGLVLFVLPVGNRNLNHVF